MKDKLTHTLPQIRCSEETRLAFNEMCTKERRTLSVILQIITEDIACHFKKTGDVFILKKK